MESRCTHPIQVSLDELRLLAQRAARGKRSSSGVAGLLVDLDAQLIQLRRELTEGSYRPGTGRVIHIRDPKPRIITALPFRDRIVQHLLIEPMRTRDRVRPRAARVKRDSLSRVKVAATRSSNTQRQASMRRSPKVNR